MTSHYVATVNSLRLLHWSCLFTRKKFPIIPGGDSLVYYPRRAQGSKVMRAWYIKLSYHVWYIEVCFLYFLIFPIDLLTKLHRIYSWVIVVIIIKSLVTIFIYYYHTLQFNLINLFLELLGKFLNMLLGAWLKMC